jgi:hypothetical protein
MSTALGSSALTRRLKVAQITSGIGALVLGVGLGAMFATWLRSLAGLITAAGLIVHALGMWDAHRLERRGEAAAAPLVTALYWICWLLLAALLIGILVRS